MKQLIENFTNQIQEAIQIGESQNFAINKSLINNVVVCGLGGSGIGATFVKDMVADELSIPFTVTKGYNLPHFVDKNTLVIASSYSGNTEETIACFKEALSKNAQVVSISSNGILKTLSHENDVPLIQIPGGMPPRSCMGYSSIQLFYILYNLGLISNAFKLQLTDIVNLLKDRQEEIKSEAEKLANSLFDKLPVLYSEDSIESVTIRWRQQINENGKQLCWHHVIPEMNHNELVGWREKNDSLAVIFLRHSFEHPRNVIRFKLNEDVISAYTSNIFNVHGKGGSLLEQAMYLIHVGDWLSYNLSQLRGFDTTEVKVIDALKKNLNA